MPQNFTPQPLRMRNKIQNYAWGTRNEQAFIPRLLGISPKPDVPYAELWMGDHPNAPSEVLFEGKSVPLSDLLQRFAPQILGEKVTSRFGNRLPFLFKVLSAGEALSIQAHPDKDEARFLHARDPEHYPDDNHKPEIAIALDHLTALVGFRPLNELVHVVEKYPAFQMLAGQEETERFLRLSNAARFSDFFRKLMLRAIEHPAVLQSALSQMERTVTENGMDKERDELFLELRKKYGDDIGLLVLYLLNLVHLKNGQAIFLKAGVPHAYVKGNIIECMANSDNVIRAGLTPKFKDVPALLDILTFETGAVPVYNEKQLANYLYRLPVNEFAVRRWRCAKGEQRVVSVGGVEIWLVTSGGIVLSSNDAQMEVKTGESVLIPAALKNLTVIGQAATSEIFSAYVPV